MSTEAENVFPVGLRTEDTYATYVYTAGHPEHPEEPAASSSSSSHLAEQDGGPLAGTRMYGHSPPSSCPRIPVSPVAGTWCSSPTPAAGSQTRAGSSRWH